MIKPPVFSLIQERLNTAAGDVGAKIIYACESGSRAWGFASPDSDYDIRFIYAHPMEWYLSVDEGRDVIERPIERHALGEIDLGGWDIRKTLRLVKKSNPVVWEWLQSPVTYQLGSSGIVEHFRLAIDPFFSPITACHHYLAICRGTMERELSGPEVKIKKYFYMLRPILAAAWIERFKAVPPMEFQPLLAMLDDSTAIRAVVADLLERKARTDERIPIPRESILDTWLDAEWTRLKDAAGRLPSSQSGDGKPDAGVLDQLFRTLVGV